MNGHRFDWKWNLSDLHPDKDVNVMTCFSCGGGSSMGYKKAGFHVLGNVEIDPKINAMYVKNHHPKYNFNMDLRTFNEKEDIPEELYHLDILDGSPPCSTFSTVGKREKGWGKEKAFRLADNKVAEIATWDKDKLHDELLELKGIFDMTQFGFKSDEEELTKQLSSRHHKCPRCGYEW